MHHKLPLIFEERGFIRARIAAQRKTLAGHGKAIERLSAAGDSVCSATRWARRHFIELGLIGCVAIILRPKGLPRVFRFGKRAFFLWRIGKKIISRISSLRFFFG
ncbi:MAG: YqjK-like family protein [Betaproteobacteria bacterium]|nr:YqjK-like family protein [Betaproteobacteria bacterium]